MRKSANNKPQRHPHPPKKNVLTFFCFIFSAETLWSECLLFTFKSLNFMQYGFKIYSICRKSLMLLFTEKAEWCFFFNSWCDPANLRNREVRNREKRQIDLHFCFNWVFRFMLLKNQWMYFWCLDTCEYRCVCQYEPYINVSFPSAWSQNGTMAYSDTEC